LCARCEGAKASGVRGLPLRIDDLPSLVSRCHQASKLTTDGCEFWLRRWLVGTEESLLYQPVTTLIDGQVKSVWSRIGHSTYGKIPA
jgi:hypothetical protein